MRKNTFVFVFSATNNGNLLHWNFDKTQEILPMAGFGKVWINSNTEKVFNSKTNPSKIFLLCKWKKTFLLLFNPWGYHCENIAMARNARIVIANNNAKVVFAIAMAKFSLPLLSCHCYMYCNAKIVTAMAMLFKLSLR